MNLALSAASLKLANPRKQKLMEEIEASLDDAERWRKFNAAYHEDDLKFMRFLIPPGKRVLELGCGTGDLLAALEPSYGVGIDFGAQTLARARQRSSRTHLHTGRCRGAGDAGGYRRSVRLYRRSPTPSACSKTSTARCDLIHKLCAPSTRIVISYYSHLWEPMLKTAEAVGLRRKQPKINYIATTDFLNLMDLADFEVISREQRQLLPQRWFGLGPPSSTASSRRLPGIRKLCLRTYLVGRPVRLFPERKFSASILIPCRNERGNIENAIKRMPRFGSAQEILFVEGNSSDGTFEECERVRDAYRGQWDITVLKQDGKGKGDAVRKGFAAAKNDVLMILDADLTMPPEALPKYHAVIESGKADFVNGTRLVYPMENEAMRPLNFIANRCFAYLFSYLVNTRLTDTLCAAPRC